MAQIRFGGGPKIWSESILWQRFCFGKVSTTSLGLSMRERYKMNLSDGNDHLFFKTRGWDTQEQTSWSSTVTVVVLLYQWSADTNPCRGFTFLVQALSMDEHRHSPARMRYSKFVHYAKNCRQTPHRCYCLVAANFHGDFKLSPLFH